MSLKKYVDDKKLTDHHAITVTTERPQLSTLNEKEKNVYELIVKRLLSIFMKPLVVEKSQITMDTNGHLFKTIGRQVFGRGGGAKQSVVGLDESIYVGKITPIELKALEIVGPYMNYGIDHFIAMIQYIAANYEYLNVSLNFVYLPLGRKFSSLQDGRRRICAIARVTNGSRASYILEVAVPDNRSLSNLLIPSKRTNKEDELFIMNLLQNLVYASGKWSHSFLYNQENTRVKHFKESCSQWATRLIRYL